MQNSKCKIQNPFSTFHFSLFIAAVLLPLPLLTSPLHHDEALYAGWARLIAGGIDPMLNTVPVDKPPLFIYTLAGFFKLFGVGDVVARMPSLLAHVATLWLVYRVGAELYRPAVGLIAALLLALSPFAVLFAPTILTDPLMVALAMASLLAAVRGKSVWAGVWLALAVATKQQGIFFLPLTLAFLVIHPLPSPLCPVMGYPPARGRESPQVAGGGRKILPFFLTLAIGLALPLVWDMNRTYRPGFWLQSSLSYGQVSLTVGHFGERLAGFLNLLGFATATPALNIAFAAGLVILLATSHWRQHARTDWLLAGFSAGFVGLHALFTFQIWDRYMLGLMPLLALLAARVIFVFHDFNPSTEIYRLNFSRKDAKNTKKKEWFKVFATLRFGARQFVAICEYLCPSVDENFRRVSVSLWVSIAMLALTVTLLAPATIRATRGEYPIGGDHGAYTGAAEVSAYLRGHIGANVTLYQRWLGTHWRYYLLGFPYDVRFWQSADELAQFAAANADGVQYIAFPAWQSTTPATLSLAAVGLQMKLVFKTYRPDGSPGVFLYRIVPVD